uniref:O-antigen polymerase n=1 Tax=uncultured Chloroflexota bacterium TaxID=166587 RepID=H5SBD5_9CHLR|nr:O-antigen polymerase [uncultured Chloroflexota bacterium]
MLDWVIFALAFTFASFRPTVFAIGYPVLAHVFNNGPIATAFWALATALASWVLIRNDQFDSYAQRFRKNPFLLLFIALALSSVFWSIQPILTLYCALELLFATLLGVYFGLRHSPEKILEALFWFGVVIVFLSYFFVIRVPNVGTMPGYPSGIFWRGIFWHRNHLGSMMAFFQAVYLLRFFLGIFRHNSLALLDAIFFVLSLVLVVMSQSATGSILTIFLDGLLLAGLVWLRVRQFLKPIHYYALGAAAVAGSILLFANLDFVFGLFNRSPSMTGRVPMWGYLLQHVVPERPWLGYGFGAIWRQKAFQVQVQQAVGWPFPVLIGDNGYMDILLYLGGIGLALFMASLVSMAFYIVRYLLRHPSLLSFFPFLVLAHALVANISFSLFLELEAFVWLMVVLSYSLSLRARE